MNFVKNYFLLLFLLLMADTVVFVASKSRTRKMTLEEYFEKLNEIEIFQHFTRLRKLLRTKHHKLRNTVTLSTPAPANSRKWTEISLAPVHLKPEPWQERPLCTGHIQECKSDFFCQSKWFCQTTESPTFHCCAPNYRFCPPMEFTGITQCLKARPIDWCWTDKDCHPAPTKRCCPTICGYNICV